MPVYQRELSLGEGDNEGRLFLVWPVIIQHCINDASPLWDVNADDLQSGHKHFEIIVVLEGIVECTGMTTQVSAESYLMPNTHRRRDLTVRFCRVGAMYGIRNCDSLDESEEICRQRSRVACCVVSAV